MSRASEVDQGFSIVEVLIAMFLLAIVAVALLPALFQGIQYSSQQSAVATATRQLNALVQEQDQLRLELAALKDPQRVYDVATDQLGMLMPRQDQVFIVTRDLKNR